MIDTTKPTRGPWNVFERRPAGYLCGYSVGGDGDVPVAACNFGDTANKANADLICEAGTVYHETNLTPRQLLERVRELEAALAGAEKELSVWHESAEQADLAWYDAQERGELPFFGLKKIRAVLAKHGG